MDNSSDIEGYNSDSLAVPYDYTSVENVPSEDVPLSQSQPVEDIKENLISRREIE
jgi:hypothetical protein